MSASYRVTITPSALRDMEEIYSYISDKLFAPQAALRQYDRIADAAQTLSYMPERFQRFSLPNGKAPGLRRRVVDNYSLFYYIRGDEVIVTNVLYSAMDLSKRLQ